MKNLFSGTPGRPYGAIISNFNMVERNMRNRREEVRLLLRENEAVFSLTNFPRLGCPDFTYPSYSPRPWDPECAAQSIYFPDEAIFAGHPRFKTLTRNIRERRGEKVSIKIKIFKDENTVFPVEGSLPHFEDNICLDAMGEFYFILKKFTINSIYNNNTHVS